MCRGNWPSGAELLEDAVVAVDECQVAGGFVVGRLDARIDARMAQQQVYDVVEAVIGGVMQRAPAKVSVAFT
jgi:hypothetical protein